MVDHLAVAPVAASLARAATTVADLVIGVPTVGVDALAPEVDSHFRLDERLGSVVVRTPSGPVLLSRDRFERHMAGRLGYGRAVYARRTVASMLPPVSVVLDPATDLATAARAVLGRHADERYDDVVVGVPAPGAEQAAVMTVRALLETLAREFARQALHDPLTGLANRSLLAEHARLRLADDGTRTAVLFVDLDRFKAVNDRFGHEVGDMVLVEFARRLEAIAGRDGVAARLGGDEFAVVTPARTQDEAIGLGEQVVMAASSPFIVGRRVVDIGASVGVAHLDRPTSDGALVEGSGAGTFDTAEVLLRRADMAMYRAKKGGRNRVATLAETERSVDMAALLAEALAGNQLRLHYQPIVRLPDRALIGVEALARWRHPDLGTVPPAQFVAAAEAAGMIGELSRWVLDEACRQAVAWGEAVPFVSVNLSPLHLVEGRAADDVLGALAASGLPATRLQLEVTESAALTDVRMAAADLRALRAAGARIALDDFGTGASSLMLLRHLPVDVVKIDRVFVDAVDSDPTDAMLVRLVTEVAHAGGRTVCAEGVERPGQLAALTELGCDSAQGYLLGMPVPAADLAVGDAATAPAPEATPAPKAVVRT